MPPRRNARASRRRRAAGSARFFQTAITGTYKRFLQWSLHHRALIIVPITALLIASIALIPLKVIQTEFMPTADQSKLIVDLDLGAGAGYPQTDAKVSLVEKHLLGIPEVEDVFATIGSDTAVSTSEIIVKLKDKSARRKSQSQLAAELRAWGRTLPGTDISVTEPGIVARSSIDGAKSLILNLSGPNRDVLRALSQRVEDAVRSVPGAADVDNTMRAGETQISVRVDRLAAAMRRPGAL